jgi:hypothetical protein
MTVMQPCRACGAELDPDDVFFSDVTYCDACSKKLDMEYHKEHGDHPDPTTRRFCHVCRDFRRIADMGPWRSWG